MIRTFAFALAVATLGVGAYSAKMTDTHGGKSTVLARGGSNCPVYYGCPAPPPPAPKGGGNSGGGNSGGGSNSSPTHA